MRRGQEIPYVAGGTLYLTLCNVAQHYNGVDVCEPRAPSFTITSALNRTFPNLPFLFFHDPALYAASKRPFVISQHISAFITMRLNKRSLLRLNAVYDARDMLRSGMPLEEDYFCARAGISRVQLIEYWLHLFELQHLPVLFTQRDSCCIPFPGEHCTIHAGCLPALPIVAHSKFIIRGKEPLCTQSNASVHLLLNKIFNKALPHVCMFRSLNLTLIPLLDNRQIFEFLNDLLLVFLTGGYPTARVRPSLTVSAAIVSMLRAFDPRRNIVEQHMGVHLTNYTKELFTICLRKFQEIANVEERHRRAHELALVIHNMWVYQFVLLYQMALYEFIHVGGSIWMYASDTVHNVDPRHRAYLILIRDYADNIRSHFIACFEPLAERMIDTPLDISYVTAWRSFRDQCIKLNSSLKAQLPKYIVRTRTSVEKRLYKSISSHAKNVAKPTLSWRESEWLSRLAAVTVCDPTYCGPKFRAMLTMGIEEAVCKRIEEIAFGFMGGTASKHMTFKSCAVFVQQTPPKQVAMIEQYLLLCRRYAEMCIAPLDADIRDQQRSKLLARFGRVETLLPVQHDIYYCVPHQQCLITVTHLEQRHTHISAFQLALPVANEALADIDGPRKTKPSLAISQFTGRAVCSYSVGSKKTSDTLLLDNREASHTSLLGFIISFQRFERTVFCAHCASRCREQHGLWCALGPTCGIHKAAFPSTGHDISSGVASVDAAYTMQPASTPNKCIYSMYNTLENACDSVHMHMQTWDNARKQYCKIGLCYMHETDLLTHIDFQKYKAHTVVNLESVQRVVHALFRAKMAKRFGADDRYIRK